MSSSLNYLGLAETLEKFNKMRKIKYKILPPIGSYEPEFEGTLIDLVQAMPYLFVYKIIPPLAVLNEIFMRGIYDMGMSGGCEWTPFKISESEYKHFVQKLLELPNENLCVETRLSKINSFDEWFEVINKRY